MHWYKDRPILVTGGAGFIGSYVVEALVKLGARVTVLDNLSTGSLDNLLAVRNNITFITGDIRDISTCLQATLGIHTVFHLAAMASVPASFENPESCHATNVTGTVLLLEAARINKVQRLILSSSAAVYGAHEGVCHEDLPCKPTSPYGYSKWIDELYCQQYAQFYGIKTVCLRYFNVWGVRQDPVSPFAGIMTKLRHQMLHNQPIRLLGDGLQTRDFVHVNDVVRANLVLGAVSENYLNGQPFNIATGKSVTLLEVIASLKTEFPDYIETISFAPARMGDIKHSAADCSKFKSLVY